MIIILSNGNVITNVEQNVDLFFTTQPLTEKTFEGGLDRIIFDYDEDENIIKTNQSLTCLREENGGYTFAFVDMPLNDLRYAQTRSDILYIAMMADVELGEEPEGLSFY